MNSALDFGQRLRTLGQRFTVGPALILISLGITANNLTVLGMLFSLTACIYLFQGSFVISGILLLFGGLCDALDGQVARLTKTASKTGAFLDAVFDRVSDTAPLLTLLVLFTKRSDNWVIITVVASALLLSNLVAYTKARGEGLGCQVELGLASRAVRFILLEIGIFSGSFILVAMLFLIAVGSLITVVQRMHSCLQQLQSPPRSA